MDGNWILMFPHCMFPVETNVPGLPGLNYPDVYQNQQSMHSVNITTLWLLIKDLFNIVVEMQKLVSYFMDLFQFTHAVL